MSVSPNASPKVAPETLVLHSNPRRVVRFKRGLIIGTAAVGALALCSVMALALRMPSRMPASNEESYAAQPKAPTEVLSGKRASYADNKPVLGAPLPGDLGQTVVRQEAAYGVATSAGGQEFEQDPEANDARAERIRLAQQARRAKEASVFFPLSQNRASTQGGSGRDGNAGPAGEDYGGQLALNSDGDQNHQQRKQDFMNQPGMRSVYNAYPLQDAVSPFQVMAGTLISASLITGINSDLPGLVVAQITENIFDTVSGRYLLIPQGSRLIGSYDSVVAFGQSRALLVWQRIIMPDGSSVQIENLPATDPSGYAGLADKVDYHTWRLLKGVVLATLLGVGTELSISRNESDLVQAIRDTTQQNVNRAGQRITEKNLSIQPTISIRQGANLRVIVHKDLILRPYKG